jgi:hypothetical protein
MPTYLGQFLRNTVIWLSSMIWGQKFVENYKENMGHMIINPSILCHARNLENHQWIISSCCPMIFEFFATNMGMRYDDLFPCNFKGFLLIRLHCFSFHKGSLFSVQFIVSFNLATKPMAHVARAEPNIFEVLLFHNCIKEIIFRDGFWANSEAFDKIVKNPSLEWGHLLSMQEVYSEMKWFHIYSPFSKEKFLINFVLVEVKVLKNFV